MNNIQHNREWFTNHRNYYFNNKELICVNCGSDKDLHLHHIVPLALGGTNNLGNIVVLCGECHSKVHSKDMVKHSELVKKGKEVAKAKAKAEGRTFKEGRPQKHSNENLDNALKLLTINGGSMSYTEVAKLTKISKSTLIRENNRRKVRG